MYNKYVEIHQVKQKILRRSIWWFYLHKKVDNMESFSVARNIPNNRPNWRPRVTFRNMTALRQGV
jgi:hypothetical protein